MLENIIAYFCNDYAPKKDLPDFVGLKQHISKAIILLAIVLFVSCDFTLDKDKGNSAYNFFMAGHTYGFRWVDTKGLHPPFMEKFDLINENQSAFGFLLGDIVFECTDEDWNEVDSVLNSLDFPQ